VKLPVGLKNAERGYGRIIAELAPQDAPADLDARHIEAFMRLQYGTLDHLDRATFRREIKIALACIAEGGNDDAEALAESYGL
jgi:hypothetical protein